MGEIELVEPPCPEQAFVDRVLRSTAPSQCRRRFWLNRVALWLYRCQLSLSFFFLFFSLFLWHTEKNPYEVSYMRARVAVLILYRTVPSSEKPLAQQEQSFFVQCNRTIFCASRCSARQAGRQAGRQTDR